MTDDTDLDRNQDDGAQTDPLTGDEVETETDGESGIVDEARAEGAAFAGELRTTGERYDQGKPKRPSIDGGDRLGARIGDAIAGFVSTTTLNLTLATSRLIPGSQKMWRGLLRGSYKGLKKSSSADVIGNIMVGDQAKHVPLEYDHERGRYRTLAEDPEWWDTSGQYQDRYHVGSTPVVFASAAANDVGDHIQAEVAKALDLGKEQYLYQDAQLNHIEMFRPAAGAGANGDAVADGGRAHEKAQEYLTVEDPGILADKVIDLTTEDDGRVVSWDNYTDTYPETAASEKMKEERQLGRLMEQDDDHKAIAVKLLLIAGAIIVGSFAAAFVLPALLGSGGSGGGGSVLPVMMRTMGLI